MTKPLLISLTATVLTKEVCFAQTLRVLDSNTNYQCIPCSPHSFLPDRHSYLRDALNLSKNKVIDVSIPTKGELGLTRYIFADGNLIGVKHSNSGNNDFKTISTPFGDNIPCGQFFLKFGLFSLGIVFASQITQDEQILKRLYNLGCDVLSIVNDLPQKKNENITQKLLDFTKNKGVALVVSTMRYSPKPNLIYGSTGYQGSGAGESFISSFGVHVFNNSDFRSQNSSLTQQIQLDRLRSLRSLEFDDTSTIQVRGIKVNLLKFTIYSELSPNQSKQIQQYKKSTGVMTLTPASLYVLYLFKNVNKNRPFVLKWPLQQSCRFIFEAIEHICSDEQIKRDKILILYGSGMFLNDPVINDISNLSSQQCCIYVQDHQQIQKIKSLSDKFILCHNFIPPSQSILGLYEESDFNVQARKLLKSDSMDIGDLKSYVQTKKWSQQEKIGFIKKLKLYAKQNLRLNPIGLFLLFNDLQAVISTLNQFIQIQNNKNKPIQRQNNLAKDLKKRVKQFRQKYKNKCHFCQLMINSFYGVQCQQCRNWHCYECLSHQITTDIQNGCPICLKLCCCYSCKPKTIDKQLEMSIIMQTQTVTNFKFQCILCQIQGQELLNIKLICQQCQSKDCYQCAKRKGINIDFSKKYRCNDCRRRQFTDHQNFAMSIIEPQSQNLQDSTQKQSVYNNKSQKQSVCHNRSQRNQNVDSPSHYSHYPQKQALKQNQKPIYPNFKSKTQRKNQGDFNSSNYHSNNRSNSNDFITQRNNHRYNNSDLNSSNVQSNNRSEDNDRKIKSNKNNNHNSEQPQDSQKNQAKNPSNKKISGSGLIINTKTSTQEVEFDY